MKKEDWTQRLRDQLADHREPVSDDLWDRIQSSLPPQRHKKSHVIPVMRWAVAASFLALALGGSYLMWQGKDHSFQETADVTMPEKPLPQVTLSDAMQPSSHAIAQTCVSRPVPLSGAVSHTPPLQGIDSMEKVCDIESIDNTESTEKNERAEKTDAQTIPQTPRYPTEDKSVTPSPPTPHHHSTSRHLALNLYASNNISQMNDQNPVAIGGEMAQAYYSADASLNGNQGKRLSPIYLANYSESKKHHLPLALGLTANYPLSNKFSVSTGVVYTRLKSDFTYSMNNNHIKKEQLLQYIGIPLSIHYQWWMYKNCQAYLSLGGQMDWNVKAEVKTGNTATPIDKDRCQWSINGSLGLQYGIIPQLSLYAEPGVKHYFNNNSKIDNIFKDKSTQFNIELGLRFHLSK